MRTIKFRFWNSLHKEMIYDCGLLPNKHFAEFMSETGGLFVNPSSSKHRIVMQNTGLLDNNGKEIWEGDIVQRPNGSVQEVEYTTDVVTNCGCCNAVKVVGYDFSDFADPSECLVIGNIHENPDLLK